MNGAARTRHRAPRLALFTKHLAGGGAQRVLINLAHGFLAAGYQVDVVVARADGTLRGAVPAGARLVDLGARRAITALPALARYFRAAAPDAALATINYANVTALLARRLCGARFPLTVREANILSRDTYTPRSLKTRVLRVLMRLTYRWAHAVVVNSADTRRGLIEWGIAGADSIHHIPNPLDLESVAHLARQRPDHPWLQADPSIQAPVVLGVGRLVPQKDYPTLIEAFALLHRQTPAARLIILGEGPLRAQLEELIRGLGLGAAVSMPGFVANPYAWMKRASLFVLSSRWEGSPNVVAEALACGAAVVATDAPGGARELLAPGAGGCAPGLLTPVGDAAALAAAMRQVLAQPHRPDLCRAAVAAYSLDRIVPRYAAAMGLASPEAG
ncbi:MAG: glycosyltransferase [Spirochaetaceae bacterium]|nr:MAG: glycosyltransferase [Spirochaetaceae bacterium]